MNHFWIGFVAFPLMIIAAILLLIFIARLVRIYKKYLKGLPRRQWFYQSLLIIAFLGLDRLKVARQGSDWKNIDGRWYFSPDVLYFIAPEEQDEPEEFGPNYRIVDTNNA